MKRRCLTIPVILLLAALSLVGCSKNKPVETKPDGYKLDVVSKTVYTVFQVPAWLLFPPSGETTVGFALVTNKRTPTALDLASDFAQSSFAQYNRSYSVDPQEIIRLSEELNPAISPSDVKLSLVQDNDYSPAKPGTLKPLAETELQGYKIYLMGTGNPPVNHDIVRASVDRTPKWCMSQETTEDDDFVYVIGTAINPFLPDAWKIAQENAMHKLGQYRVFNSLSEIRTTESQAGKLAVIDIATRNPQASISKTWLFHKQVNGSADYSVFIMLKAAR